MKFYKDKIYESYRTNDPKDKKSNVANREDFCCDELFRANLDIIFTYWNDSELTFVVFGEESGELDFVKYCPFCGEKFEIVQA